MIFIRKAPSQGIYVDRSSPLGNPYRIQWNDRVACIKRYRKWLAEQEPDSPAVNMLRDLIKQYNEDGIITLVCHCFPLLCHANVIAKYIEPGITVAGTGHRPPKLGGYGSDVLRKITDIAKVSLTDINPVHVISGGALGWDTALALASYELGIPYTIAVPFTGQESKWPAQAQTRYKAMLREAAEVVIVSSGGFSANAMQRRNEYMVDRCDILLTMYGGGKGGTYNCINYQTRSLSNPKLVNLWEKM